MFTSLRIAAPWSVLGVIFGEWLATGGRIGGAPPGGQPARRLKAQIVARLPSSRIG
jgi:hypothetical protein